MKLLQFSALADAVSVVRKYKCGENDIEARAVELAQLLVREFVAEGSPAVKSARLFFLPYSKVTDSTEKAVVTETEIRNVSSQRKRPPARKGTVMAVCDNGEDAQSRADSGTTIVATVRATEDSQLVVTLELSVQLSAEVTPYFRVLATVLAAKLTDCPTYSKDSVEEWAELYDLAHCELTKQAAIKVADTNRSLLNKTTVAPGLPQSQREDFMSSLAHDLKVPVIGAIRALDALLQGYVGPLEEKQIEFIQCLYRSNLNLLLMVKNLIQVLRYESGEDQFICEHFDLVSIVNDCMKDAVPSMQAKHIEHELHTPKKLIVIADRSALKTLVLNLVSNAINSAPENSMVKVDLHSSGELAALQVQNAGEPISEEDMEQLFQRIWQGKRFGAGAGLGLYLCRQIAEGHGGTMSCKSSREEGTIMRFTVPIDASGLPPRK